MAHWVRMGRVGSVSVEAEEIYPVDDVMPVNDAGEIQRRFPCALVIGGDGRREQIWSGIHSRDAVQLVR